MVNIEYVKNAKSSDLDFIADQISKETPGYGEVPHFAFFIRDKDLKIIAGASGFLIYGAVYTDMLWVSKPYRDMGYARAIMDKVHKLGADSGCKFATIQTMDFQGALSFYKKLGYEVDFCREGHVKESKCFFLKKML